MLVLHAGQEALIRRMVSPEPPDSYRLVEASIVGAGVHARYVDPRGARAEMHVLHKDASSRGIATATLRVRFLASNAGDAEKRFFAKLLATVRAHERALAWGEAADASPSPAAEGSAFRALDTRGHHHEALQMIDAARAVGAASMTQILAAAELRATLYDEERAARDAREVLLAGTILEQARAALVLAKVGAAEDARAFMAGAAPGAPRTALAPLALVAEALGDFDAAVELHERNVRSGQDATDSLLALGTLAAWRGDMAVATRNATRVLERTPENAGAQVLLSIARTFGGDDLAALTELDAATRAAPHDPVPALFRAEVLLRLGRLDEALTEALRGGDLTSDRTDHVPALLIRAAVLARSGRPEPLEPVLAEAMSVLVPEAPMDYEAALRALVGNRSHTPTRCSPSGALERIPTRPSARTAAKQALWKIVGTASVHEAERDFDRVQTEYPDVPEVFNYRGELFLYLGDAARATQCFERALALYDRSRWALIGLGGAALLEGRPGEALAVLEKGVELGGAGPTTYAYRGEAHLRLGNLAAARADLETAVGAHPTRIGAWTSLGLAELAQGDEDGFSRTMGALWLRAPDLLAEAGRHAEGRAELLEECLTMLRGNRSSTCVTYFTREGRLRAVPPRR